MSRTSFTSLCFFVSALALPVSAGVPDGWFVWPVVEPKAGTALDTSSLNPVPAGALGRVAVKDGVFVDGAGHPLRFFGVNVTSDDAFPTEADAELLAARLAKGGVNIVRLHHLDNSWGVGKGGSLWPAEPRRHQELDTAQLDRLHRLVAILAKHGIYSNVNLKVSKTLVAADGFPASVEQLPDFQKRVDIYDRRMIELQKDYARRLLTTKNPYTGLSLAEDPAVAVVEINNENSLLGYFTRDLGRGADRFPEPFRSDLQAKWNTWLGQRYGNTVSLEKAWADAKAAAAEPFDRAKATWSAKVQRGSEATITPGPDGSAFVVDVAKAGGPDWHVQVSTLGLTVTDNTVYTLSFEARALAPAKLGVGISNDSSTDPHAEWRSLGLLQSVDVGKEWTPVRLAFPVHSVGADRAMLSFNVGAQTGRIEIRNVRFFTGAAEGGLRPGQTLEARNIPIPGEPTTRQWADWIAFLAETERTFAEEMRAFLRNELHVKAPLVCSQINFSGLPALDREQSMEFADTHVYWQHPLFPGTGWDRENWTIANSPMVSVFGARRFGELGNLAYTRVAGKPFAVSEYDHAAPSDYVSEMYPELAIFAARQNWDAIYPFDLGAYGSRNPDGRITGYFDQINHPAKWSLAPFATRVFRLGLVPPAGVVAELRPGQPVWGEAMHFDMLWAKLIPDQPFDFLNQRLQVNDRPTGTKATLFRSGKPDTPPAVVVKAPLGQVLVAQVPEAAVATGFIGGATIEAGAFRATSPRFGRDFGTIAAVALDGKPLMQSSRILVTLVARAENQGMKWNESRTSVGLGWGVGPTIAERVPALLDFKVDGIREVYALNPDGTRAGNVPVSFRDGILSFRVADGDRTVHYEIVKR